MLLTPSSTCFDIYERYTNYLRNQNQGKHTERLLKSTLIRFIIPALGGSAPKGLRATSEEIRMGLEHLKNVPPLEIASFPEIAERAFEKNEVSKAQRRRFRSYVKQFVDWVVAREYCEPIKRKQKFEFKKLHASSGQARRDWHNKSGLRSDHNRGKKANYALGAKNFPQDYFNSHLLKQLEDYKYYRLKVVRCSVSTIDKELHKIKQLLGWLHRYKNTNLENLVLISEVKVKSLDEFISSGGSENVERDHTSLVSFVPLLVSLGSCQGDYNRHVVESAIAKEVAKSVAEKHQEVIEDFLDFLNGHINSQIAYIDVVIALVRYAYRQELSSDDFSNPRDIPILRRLLDKKRTLARDATHAPPKVPFEEKSIPWHQAVVVLEKLRLRAEQQHLYYMSRRDGLVTKYRTPYALIRDLQDFLSVAFSVLIPPQRPRVYYELELGRTLISGIFNESHFTPKTKMKDPSSAIWYIHLEKEDYKTGKSYGTYWCPLPNTSFPDGKTLYGYIEQWLTLGRAPKGKVSHNFFFRCHKSFKPMSHVDWRNRIVPLFDREANIPVSPKELRAMYVTFLYDQEASETIQDCTATTMAHGRTVQRKFYNKQVVLKKTSLAVDFCQQVAQEVFSTLKL